MSDLSELFTDIFDPASTDPKKLTPAAFIAKETQNIKNGIAALPAVVQPFVDTTVATAGALVEAAAPLAGSAVGGLIATAEPEVEAWFLGLLGEAFGAAGAAAINQAVQTPAGQTVVQQIGTAAQALVAHLAATASAGALAVVTAVEPPATGG